MSLLRMRDVLSPNDLRNKALSNATSPPTEPDAPTERGHRLPEIPERTLKEAQTAYHIWPLVSMAIVILQAKQQHTLPFAQQGQTLLDKAIEFFSFGSILQDLVRFRLQPPSPQELSWFEIYYGISHPFPALQWYSTTFHAVLNFHYGIQEITSSLGGLRPQGTDKRFRPDFVRFRGIVDEWCSQELGNRESNLEEFITNHPFLVILYDNMSEFYVRTALPWYNKQKSQNRYVQTCA